MLDQNLFLYTFTGHKSFKTQVITYVDMVFANIQIINPKNNSSYLGSCHIFSKNKVFLVRVSKHLVINTS